MSPPGATTAARASQRATSDASNATHAIGPSVQASPRITGCSSFILSTGGVEPRVRLPRFGLREVWGVQELGGPLDAVIPGESATPAEPELRIACERRGEAARADQR